MLMDKIVINRCELPHRLVMPPMATRKSEDGKINDSLIDYYTLRAGNEHIGLIITEHSYVDFSGQASRGQISLADDDCLEGLKRLTESIHSHSKVKLFAQISHAGYAADTEDQLRMSADEGIHKNHPYHMMNQEEIRTVTAEFARAASRVKLAGFDGVEIHGAHGYLLNQFYSPLSNHRTDEYGPQCLENRIRFHLEVIRGVRKAVGPDFPVSLRFGGCDYCEGGSTIEDAVQAAVYFQKAGADLLSISGGMNGFLRKNAEGAYFADQAKAIKASVSVTVLLTGGLTTIQKADEAIEKNYCDLAGIGRALLANPNL